MLKICGCYPFNFQISEFSHIGLVTFILGIFMEKAIIFICPHLSTFYHWLKDEAKKAFITNMTGMFGRIVDLRYTMYGFGITK